MREFSIDDSNMPVRLGSALRVPSYAYGAWGIPEGMHRDSSDALYESEWRGGSPRQMQYVIDATTSAGLGNYSGMLRNAAAETVSRIVKSSDGRVNILEPGAGVSTETMIGSLYYEGVDLDRLTITMLEPGQLRLEQSTGRITGKFGLRVGTHLHPHVAKDVDARRFVERGSQNIVVCVAQIHHHSYLDTPVRELSYVTAPGGYLVTADWHNSMWENPARVYQFLQGLDWETKDADLEAFRKEFPGSTGMGVHEDSPSLREANHHIRRFWEGWAKIRAEAIAKGEFDPADDILMLEGHRPVLRYVDEMRAAGYVLCGNGRGDEISPVSENPSLLIPNNEILAEIVAVKPME